MDQIRRILASRAGSDFSGRHPVRLSDEYRDRLVQVATGQAEAYSTVDKELAQAIMLCGFGAFDEGERVVLTILDANLDLVWRDEEVFFSIFHTLAVVQRFDLAAAMLEKKYDFPRKIEMDFEVGMIGESCIRWDISKDGAIHKFVFDTDILRNDNARTRLMQFKWAFPLIAHYARQSYQEFGSVYLNQADVGLRPGLAYSDGRPEYFLIPDYVFVPTGGYSYAREILQKRSISWDDRLPVAFWRGTTTGVPATAGDWRSLDRIKLCQTAQQHSGSGLFDVGFSSISQIPDPQVVNWIEASGMALGRVPWEDWGRYKFLIDIDGNSSPWSNLIQRLLTGSPVLKVESRRNLAQWYYDDLLPWTNYVPIASDCSDLLDKVQWLAKHDDSARRIGENGFDFVQKLTYQGELERSVPVISAAFRYFRGNYKGVAPYGRVSERQLITENSRQPETVSVLHTGGLGDILLATPALRAFKAKHPGKRMVFYGNYRQLLEGLPYIDELHPETDAPPDSLRFSYGGGSRLSKHIAKIFGETLNVNVSDVRPDCATDADLVEKYRELFADLPRPWIAINRRASAWTPNKDWPNDKWNELISRLRPHLGIIEIGNPPTIQATDDEAAQIDLVGKTNLTELIGVIAACDILVTPVSGPMHIAAATHTPAVVIYGGYEQALATEYQGNISLVSTPDCSPCWLREPCPIDKKCLRDITVDEVEASVWRIWNQSRSWPETHENVSTTDQADEHLLPNSPGKVPAMDHVVTLGRREVSTGWPVKGEPQKTFRDKLESGFFMMYMSGQVVIDVGYWGNHPDAVPILPYAIGVDHGYPGYDGLTLPFPDETVDSVYSSHTLEHISDYIHVIRDWYRVTKIGGFIVTVVPHQFLYEKRQALPSRWNPDHQRFYTPASLLREFEEALVPNSYRVRHLRDNDKDYLYQLGPDHHGHGGYEIELVIEKIARPNWDLLD
jgi:ADP-heptose:LPS heptosyltransferase